MLHLQQFVLELHVLAFLLLQLVIDCVQRALVLLVGLLQAFVQQ